MSLLPEIARRRPTGSLAVVYLVPGAALPERADVVLGEALRRSGFEPVPDSALRYTVRLAGRTRVWGLVAREVEETIGVEFQLGVDGAQLRLSLLPQETHDAHAAGLAGALILGVTVWLTAGWITGIPAGVTTVLAGGLWTDVSRTLAFNGLEARLRALAFETGRAIWPRTQGQLLPPTGPSRLLWRW